mgnify:CR=1 FL=1
MFSRGISQQKQVQLHQMPTGTLSDGPDSPLHPNDLDERNSQKETIQMYASREVSNNPQEEMPTRQVKRDQMSLVKLKQRMNNSSSVNDSQTSLTRVNNRYKQ